MDQAVEERTETGSQGQTGDVVAEAIAYTKKAQELRVTAIEKLLKQRERIEQDLKTLGYVPTSSNGNGMLQNSQKEMKGSDSRITEHFHIHPKRFKGLTLAAVGQVLLREHETLHGKEIEKLAKAGGFQGGAKNFQNYMPVAFKRDGGFENIGGNTWKLKQS